jgi:hypothetical protein
MEVVMKKMIIFLLMIGLAFFLGSCNDPAGGPDNPIGGGGVDVVFNWGTPGSMLTLTDDTSEKYKGREIPLEGCPDRPATWGNISEYGEAILLAVLYDADGEEITSTENGLAQFHLLLDGSSGWGNENKLATGENLVSQVEKSASPTGKQGKPGKLLVQGNETYTVGDVAKVEVRKLTLKPKTSDVVLKHIFGDSAVVSGNKITFTNACYSSTTSNNNINNWDGTTGVGSAVLYVFDSSFFPLNNKSTLTFNFKLENITRTGTYQGTEYTLEHQLNIQAAQDTPEKDKFNGQNPSSGNNNIGQKYITLDGPNTASQNYNSETASGWFTISVPDLVAASGVSISGDDGNAPFDLDSVRISNNGTAWNDTTGSTAVMRVRDKNYTLVIESVTIK